jgi:hypothetical protein
MLAARTADRETHERLAGIVMIDPKIDVIEDIEMLLDLARSGDLEGFVFVAKMKDHDRPGEHLSLQGICTETPKWFAPSLKAMSDELAPKAAVN